MRRCGWGLLVMAWFQAGHAGMGADDEPEGLVKLRSQYEAKLEQLRKPVEEGYLKYLRRKENEFIKNGSLEFAFWCRNEKHRLELRLDPVVVSDKHYARIGKPEERNVFELPVEKFGSNTTLRIWMIGESQENCSVKIMLNTPDGHYHVLDKVTIQFAAKEHDDTGRAIRPKELNAYTEDVTKYVKTSGMYKVTFEHTGGGSSLAVFEAALTLQ